MANKKRTRTIVEHSREWKWEETPENLRLVPCTYQLGIDLGTSYTRTAIIRNDTEIIPHEGLSMMPSCVAFTESSLLVGMAACLQADVNPSNTIFGVLRFLCQAYSNPDVQLMIEKSPFSVVDNKGVPAFLIIRNRGNERKQIFTPEEVLALILCKVRIDAQTFLRTDTTTMSAVITVPASFSFPQRQLIRNVAELAGFSQSHVISTPIAIGADYFVMEPSIHPRDVLIIDVGAGFLDVAIISIDNGKIKVKAADGHQDLGGEFVTDSLMQLPWKNLEYSHHQLRSLRIQCEQAKNSPSLAENDFIVNLPSYNAPEIMYTISLSDLANSCKPIMFALAKRIESVLSDAGLSESDIDTAIITGGTSRIPPIQRSINRYLEDLKVWRGPTPDEAAARGAAYLSTMLFSWNKTEDFLVDAAPVSISFQTDSERMITAVRRNTALPIHLEMFLNSEKGDGQIGQIEIYEGEEMPLQHDKFIGRLSIQRYYDTPPQRHTELRMDYSFDGAFTVTGRNIPHFDRGRDDCQYDGASESSLEYFHWLPEQGLTRIRDWVHYFVIQEKLRMVKVTTKAYISSLLDRLSPQLSTHAPRMQSWIWTIADRSLALVCRAPEATYEDYLCVQQRLEKLVAELILRFPDLEYLRSGEMGSGRQSVSDTAEKNRHSILPEPVLAEPKTLVDLETEHAPTRGDVEACLRESDIPPNKNLQAATATSERPNQPRSIPLEETEFLEISLGYNGPPVTQESLFQKGDASKSTAGWTNLASPITSKTREEPPARTETAHLTGVGITNILTKQLAEGTVFTDAELLKISTYLRNTGQATWSTVPRLYIILRLLNQLEMLDVFIEQGTTDIWFPFSLASLPNMLSPTTQAKFLDQQAIVLSKSLLFETSPERKHAHFAQDDPLPFQIVGKLGSGAHGQVDKVMSTVSHREYARKQFRRRRGTSKDAIKSFLIELQVLKRVQHLHCVELVCTIL
jgi:molecular chaperone DnaK (HSP70)